MFDKPTNYNNPLIITILQKEESVVYYLCTKKDDT